MDDKTGVEAILKALQLISEATYEIESNYNAPKHKKFKFDDDDNKNKKNVDSVIDVVNKVNVVNEDNTVDDDNEPAISIEEEIPEEGFIYPLEQDASDMLDETEFDGNFPSVTERYFTPYYQIDVIKPGDDICIRIHSNRICMISLAPSHTIFQENKTIKSCNFKVSDKVDRTQNKVSGKSKHGAQPLQSNSNLCFLSCDDGSNYTVKCCMIGKLVEVNERLVKYPELLKKEPHFGGYIAIVLPNLKHLEKTREKLLTEELYQEAIKKRKENTEKNVESDTNVKRVNEEKEVDHTEKKSTKNILPYESMDRKQMVQMEIVDERIESKMQSKMI